MTHPATVAATSDSPLKVVICDAIAEIPAAAWNGLVVDNQPFLRHEFLHALEQHGCAAAQYGWLPRHLALYEGSALIGAMPLYEKHNSYGEFVFDNGWADAYQRHGLRYFPKLVSAIPYTPAAGQRLLATPGREQAVWSALWQTIERLAKEIGASGFHCLFPQEPERAWLAGQGLLTRHDCQYHWHNRDYQSFDEFVQRLNSRKRKNIRRERQRVVEAEVTLRRLDGHQTTASDWRTFTRFYRRTFDEKWGVATLNEGFFREVARTLPDQVLLVLAEQDGRTIAGSLMYRSDTTLYGRYWGADEPLDSLHFEACYYQGIDYCIEQRLDRFEPGAQGEHKVARGFEPTLTRSCHWLADSPFQDAIEQFIEQERQSVIGYIANLNANPAFRRE